VPSAPEIHQRLLTLLESHRSQVHVDSIQPIGTGEQQVLLVRYRVAGELGSPSQFTFPFPQSVPLEDSLSIFMDYGLRNWSTAHLPPVSRAFGATGN